MIKRTTLTLLFAIALIANAIAATVQGTVIDNHNEPFGFVNVAISLNSDKSQIYGGVTDNNGNFTVKDIPAGDYTLEVSFIGYKTYTKKISLKSISDVVRCGRIQLIEDSKTLAEVEVVGQASQMRFDIDKKVFNVDQNLASSGASASEMLQNIPSVEVDNDGNISLRNSESVEVWINGKPAGLTADNRAQILEQMPAGTIEAVEVITNPSAKFNPEGTAGIINLVLKKDRKMGYYGSVSAGTGYSIGAPSPGANLGFNFNLNSSKVDFYINFGGRFNNRKNRNYTDRYSFTPGTDRLDTLSFLNNDNLGRGRHLGFFGRTGIDIHLNKKNTLSFSLMGHGGLMNSHNTNSYTQIDWRAMDSTIYERTNSNNGLRPSYNASIDYAYEIDPKGSEIRASISYGGHINTGDYLYDQHSIIGAMREYQQIQRRDGNNTRAQATVDYTQKIKDNMKVEAGLYANYNNRLSPSRTWDILENNDTVLTEYNDFNYEEWVAAAYGTYGAKFGGFSFSVGLRGEYTNTTIRTRDSETAEYSVTNKEYWQLYPTAFLAYAFPGNHELQANYTRRIRRPWGGQLNSFRNVSDSTNISFGNPMLDPEISSAAELNYIKTWDNHAITASLFYRFSDNVIQRVNYLGEDNVMYSTFENISRNQAAGIELVSKNRVAKWLNLTTTVNGYYSSMNDVYYDTDLDGVADLLYPKQQSFSWDIRLMGNFLFAKGWTAQLTAAYGSPRIVAQGRSRARYSVDLGVRKSFLDRKLNLSISIRDVLNSRRWASTTWGDNFWQYSEHAPHGTSFNVTLTYNFGNNKNRKPQRPQGDNMMNGGEPMDEMGGEF